MDYFYNKLVDSFSVFENIDIYQRPLYDSFLLPIFKGNICSAIANSKDDFKESVIDNATCKGLMNGIFTKGLLVSSKLGQ